MANPDTKAQDGPALPNSAISPTSGSPAGETNGMAGSVLSTPESSLTVKQAASPPNTNDVLSHGLSSEQVSKINDLIKNYLNRTENANISVVFPSKATYVAFFILFCAIIIGIYFIYQIPDMTLSNDEPKMKYQLAQYVMRHLTIGLIIVSILISAYKFLLYTARQYYLFNKYKILATNRIAIFSTVMLTGGKVDSQAFTHFVADFSEPNDAHETQTIHEKFMDHMFGLLKDMLPSTKGLKEFLEKKS